MTELLNGLGNRDDKVEALRATRNLNLAKAMDQGTNLVHLKLAFADEPEKLELTMYLILDFSRALMSIDANPFTEELLMQMAVEILDDENNRLFTLEEIIYAFKKGASGRYGSNYNTLNSETINRWLDGLYKEHMDRIESRHLDHKAQVSDVDPSRQTSEPKLIASILDPVQKKRMQSLPSMSSGNEDQYRQMHSQILENQNNQEAVG